MYFIFKTLKGYILSLLVIATCTCLLSSVASLILLFIHSDTFTLRDLLLAPSQLPMGQGLQEIRADIIHDAEECNRETEFFLDHGGRNCVLVEYLSNTSADKLNDFHFMQLIKISYWLFDDEHAAGSFYQSLLENPVSLPLNKTKDYYLSLSYNFSLMAENYSVFYFDSTVVQAKLEHQAPIHGLTILQEGGVVAEVLVQGFLRNHSPWLGLHWLHRLSAAVLYISTSKPGPILWILKSLSSIQETITETAIEQFLGTFPSLGEHIKDAFAVLVSLLSKFELKEIYKYPEGSDRLCRLVLAAVLILIFHKIQSYFVSYEEENLSIAKCESLLSAFSYRNKRPNSENKTLAEG